MIEWEESIKFPGILLDEDLNWKEHFKYIEDKCAIIIALLYKAKYHLNKKNLPALYFSCPGSRLYQLSTRFTNLKEKIF